MKIAFISTVHGHEWPGSEYLWSECAGRLLAAGHQVFARVSQDCLGAEVLKKLAAQGMLIEYVVARPSRVARLSSRFINGFRRLNSFAPDLMVVSSGSAFDPIYSSGLAGFLQNTSVPFVFICHFNAETFWVDEPMRLGMARIFAKAAESVFVCDENRRLTERQLAARIPKFKIIPPPLRVNLAEPLPWPKESTDGQWLMACVARLEPRWKGQDALLEVLADSKWKQRNYRLNLFGQGEEADYLQRLVKFYGLEKQVFFAGYATPVKIWADHHLQILPARGEGGPMVTTEGMMCGRVAVTTCCGHNPEYIIDGETGFLAAFPTTACFGAKMEEAWNRQNDWREMGIKAHAAIRQKATAFAAADQFMALISGLVVNSSK